MKKISLISLIIFITFLTGCKKKQPVVSEEAATTQAPETEKTFTIEQLAEFNGLNGNPAYAAVDGIVYDMSEVFEAGKHFDHLAGQELTKAFYLKHTKEEIEKYPAVGRLVK